jgi:HK97 family phage major capsid protein
LTAATLGTTAIGSSTNDGTSAGGNTIGSTDLVDLEHSVDPLYRPGARFMMHDQTLRQLKTVLDKFGRPLWLPGLAVRAEDSILGYGYSINNDMPQLQSTTSSPQVTNKTVLFGQLEKYMIRRVRDFSLIRLEERFADYGLAQAA